MDHRHKHTTTETKWVHRRSTCRDVILTVWPENSLVQLLRPVGGSHHQNALIPSWLDLEQAWIHQWVGVAAERHTKSFTCEKLNILLRQTRSRTQSWGVGWRRARPRGAHTADCPLHLDTHTNTVTVWGQATSLSTSTTVCLPNMNRTSVPLVTLPPGHVDPLLWLHVLGAPQCENSVLEEELPMKMTEGCSSLATENRARTSFSPSPTCTQTRPPSATWRGRQATETSAVFRH